MEVPDKIFLNKHMLRRGMLYPAQYPADVPEFEYIRKDTLLEWAKRKKEDVGIGLSEYDSGNENGKAEFLNELIDKIESL